MNMPRFVLFCALLALTTPTLYANTYDEWATLYFTPAELTDPLISGRNADPDGDGMTNQLEYALGADPRTPDSASQTPAWLDNDGHLTLCYNRRFEHPGIVHLPQVADDLRGPWFSGPLNVEEIQTTYRDPYTETATVRDVQATSLTSQRFIRLLIALDSDSDGMPDDWELSNGLNPFDPFDALQDTDGDGKTNREEFEAGTDPQDPYDGKRRHGIPAAPRSVTVKTHDDGSRDVYWESASDNETYFVVREHLPGGAVVELGQVGPKMTHLHIPAPGGN